MAERRYGRRDPSQVVSDEVGGYLVSVAFTRASGGGFFLRAALAFVLFRLFDIWKPGPIRRLEKLPGGLGIAADDLAAALLANACTSVALGISVHAAG